MPLQGVPQMGSTSPLPGKYGHWHSCSHYGNWRVQYNSYQLSERRLWLVDGTLDRHIYFSDAITEQK